MMDERDITAHDLKTLLARDGCFLIDVRDPEERDENRIPKSILIPTEQLEARLAGMRKDAALVLYCASGRRSRSAVDALREAGYTDVRSLRGGIEAWEG